MALLEKSVIPHSILLARGKQAEVRQVAIQLMYVPRHGKGSIPVNADMRVISVAK
jgi:hypothetical protein